MVITFTKVSEVLGGQYPDLDVCINDGSVVRVFQWQCLGEIYIDHTRGVKIEDDLFIEKARQFIQKAKQEQAGLVLTPEYSFPYVVLKEVICDKSKWPERGKLWCLGTQGESYDIFSNAINEWEQVIDVQVCKEAYNNLTKNTFVCPLIYLFLTNDGKLCIVPQFKTQPMADPRLAFEGVGLSRGNTIFVFGANVVGCMNVFFTIICADALSITATDIKNKISETSIIMFHPQLNSDPRYSNMLALREDLISAHCREVRVITLNWAEKTKVMHTPLEFNMPWSAFYRQQGDKNLQNHSFRANKERNHKKGTAYTLNNHVDIWFSYRREHCKSISIRKGDHERPRVLTSVDEPITNECYAYSNGSWQAISDMCSSNIADLYAYYGVTSEFPYPVCQQGETCDRCTKSDFFFGSLLGHFEMGEIESNSEFVDRLLVGSDEKSDGARVGKLELIVELKRLLDEGVFPVALGYFSGNYSLYVHDDFPEIGKQVVNLQPKIVGQGHAYPEALVVITDEKHETGVEELLTRLKKKLSKNYRNQILIYYKPLTSRNYIFYDKHLTSSLIMQPNYDSSLTSITNPRTSIR